MNKIAKILNHFWRFNATAFCFSIFGIGALIIFTVIFPIIALLVRNHERKERLFRITIHLSWKFFVFLMSFLGLIFVKTNYSQDIKKVRGKIIVANHPTLIDIVILISQIPHADVIVKNSLKDNFFMKGIVNKIYILNVADSGILLKNCTNSLKKGNNLIIFPEGGRTIPGKKSVISKGAAHISFLNRSDILPIKINCYPLGLLKNQKWYNISNSKMEYFLEMKDEIKVKKYLKIEKQKAVRLLNEEIKNCLELIA